jgi:hypothetical protein
MRGCIAFASALSPPVGDIVAGIPVPTVSALGQPGPTSLVPSRMTTISGCRSIAATSEGSTIWPKPLAINRAGLAYPAS